MIDLKRAKTHLRIDNDLDDTYIEALILAATAWTKNYLSNDYPETDSTNMGLVEAAELMLIAELYENREISVPSEIRRSKTFFMLLEPLKEKAVF